MARPKFHWGIVYLSAATLVYLKPEDQLLNSYVGTVATLSVIITLCRMLYGLVLYPEFFTPLKQLPTPPTRNWLQGNTKSYFLESPFAHMHEWIKTVPNEGLIRYYLVGNLERVLLTNPKALSEVLVHKAYQFPKPDLVRINLRRITGNGVLLAEGDEHKTQRRNLLPAFSYRHIKDLYPIFWSKSVEMVNGMEQQLEQQKHNNGDNVLQISNWASRATLDIIGVAGMDHDFESLQDPDNELSRQYRKVLSEQSVLMKFVVLLGLFVIDLRLLQKLPLKRNRDLKEGSEVIRSVARQMIRKKKDKLERKDDTSKTGVDIISVALQSGTFSEENLVDQMMTFLGAGHETTSTAMQWAVYALCKHQAVQSRLREEVRANLPSISTDNPEPISAATLDSLPYLNAVCNEVLRFHPSVPATIRISTQDTTIVGQPIPKGTVLMISPEVINHSQELWGPDAGKFDPERWMGPGRANTGGAESNYAFLSFLHGPRSCIGQSFAKAELACLIAVTVGRFHMELQDPNKKLEVRQGPTVGPKDGVLAKLTVLDGW